MHNLEWLQSLLTSLLILTHRLDNLSAHIKKTHGVTWQVELIIPLRHQLEYVCCLIMCGAFLSFAYGDLEFSYLLCQSFLKSFQRCE